MATCNFDLSGSPVRLFDNDEGSTNRRKLDAANVAKDINEFLDEKQPQDSPGMDSHSLHLCLHSRLSTLTIHMLLHFMDTILVSRTTRQVHPIIMDSITVSKYGNKTTQQVHPMKVVEMEVRVISWHLVI